MLLRHCCWCGPGFSHEIFLARLYAPGATAPICPPSAFSYATEFRLRDPAEVTCGNFGCSLNYFFQQFFRLRFHCLWSSDFTTIMSRDDHIRHHHPSLSSPIERLMLSSSSLRPRRSRPILRFSASPRRPNLSAPIDLQTQR